MSTIDDVLTHNPHCVAIHGDNSPDWLAVDQWATDNQLVIVPIPHFFTATQITHMAEQAGVDCVFCQHDVVSFWQVLGFQKAGDYGVLAVLTRPLNRAVKLPNNTHKITFTSGSTAQAKGVCLSLSHLQTVGRSLAQATEHLGLKRHLSILPYSILLENMAAVYANRYANKGQGLEIISPSLAQVGLQGSGHFQPKKLVSAIVEHQADSLILMPAMLKSLLNYLVENPTDLPWLRFMAVGGAVCPPMLIAQSHEMGLPVYQGYGISECGSVICLNKALASIDSVGRPLNHAHINLDQDKQIIYHGPHFLGYLGDTDKGPDLTINQAYATGDTGTIDAQGKLTIRGRLSNLIVTGFGRNISPEWVEAELLALNAIQQVMVVGDGQAFLTALCVTDCDGGSLHNLIQPINDQLPDYARVRAVVKVPAFTEADGTLTATGKLIRSEIFTQHSIQLEHIYDNKQTPKYHHGI